ncbi:MAG: folylpolyglutamate synthase/dihydrofolate synthase family protein [Bryobacteraceae bacterium]
MTYPDSVRFLYSLGNEIGTAKLGLERIRTLLGELGNPQDSCRFVHVAGTNGKGSTCAMIESGLRAAGVRTGLYTSPHLQQPTERIRILGQPVTDTQFSAAFDRVHAAAECLLKRDAIDLHPTYFETVTAMAFVLFAELAVDVVVLEVGLGGRLDATNVVAPLLSVITPVDFDHEAYLGLSLDSIAGEKAGILKAGVAAVIATQRPEAAAAIGMRAAELGITPDRAENWNIEDLVLDRFGSRFHVGGPAGESINIGCPLAGEHQVENALTAVRVLIRLGIDSVAIERGVSGVRWPGRLEHVSLHPEIVLDGAHNPSGARALAAYIERFYRGRRVTLIYGAMRDKAVVEMAGILFPCAQRVIATAPAQARAALPDTLAELAPHPNLVTAANLPQALISAGDLSPEDAVFVTGSLFLVAEARSLLVKD